jgi:hypothetical protein
MLRHAAGYKLANDGVDTRTLQAYLGHLDGCGAVCRLAKSFDRLRVIGLVKPHAGRRAQISKALIGRLNPLSISSPAGSISTIGSTAE